MNARLRILGFILYPGVPNSTAVTQETEKNFGILKSDFRSNLMKLTDDRLEAGESVSELPLKEKQIKAMKDDKKKRLAMEEQERVALSILEIDQPSDKLKVKELEALLRWQGVDKPREGSLASKRKKWSELKNRKEGPPAYKKMDK